LDGGVAAESPHELSFGFFGEGGAFEAVGDGVGEDAELRGVARSRAASGVLEVGVDEAVLGLDIGREAFGEEVESLEVLVVVLAVEVGVGGSGGEERVDPVAEVLDVCGLLGDGDAALRHGALEGAVGLFVVAGLEELVGLLLELLCVDDVAFG